MFRTHQPIVAAHAHAGGIADVAAFVLLTIQQPLYTVPDQFESIARGDTSPLWGVKRTGFDWLSDPARVARWYTDAQAVASDPAQLLLTLTRCPGLGLVKAGFLAQLVWGEVGCLDTHNLNRFQLKASAFRVDGLRTDNARLRKARGYVEVCHKLGGCEYLWDSWCEYVFANGRGAAGNYSSAWEVSAYHCRALGLPEA